MNLAKSQKEYLLKVAYLMRNACEGNLSIEQQAKRSMVLEAVEAYAKNGAYASTDDEPITPIFRNGLGTYCAVGYALVATGYSQLAQNIADQHNYIDIEEIENFERSALGVWARAHGIERSEAIIMQRYAPRKGR